MIYDISDAKYIINSAIDYNNNLKAQYEMDYYVYINADRVDGSLFEWSYGRCEGEYVDVGYECEVLGRNVVLTANQVSAPSTLAIFALGLMGLGLRRIKKQS